MPASATGIVDMSLVILPVVDQDRSIAFYEMLGLEKRTDTPFGDKYRWVEVYVPEASTGIALAPPPEGTEVTPQETGITFRSEDLVLTHATLKRHGADVDAEITVMGGPVPDMFWFRDPDGHVLMVVQHQG